MPRVPAESRIRPKGWTPPPFEEAGPDDIVITHSEIEAYRQCPLKWQLAYAERWTKTDREDDHPLTKGTLYHDVMEAHYLGVQALRGRYTGGGKDVTPSGVDEVLDKMSDTIGGLLWDGPNQSELQALVWWMYEGYLAQYGYDPQWEILGVEVKFQSRIKDPRGNPTRYLLKGKLDLVVRDRKSGKIWIVDHKSGKDLPNQMELDVADQFGCYAWLLREAGIPTIGVIHSANRTTMNQGDRPENQDENGEPIKKTMAKQTLDQRMRRTLLARSDKELDSIARDVWAVACNMYPEYSGLQALPMYSSPDPRSCGWKCDFLDAHLMARKGRDIRSVLKEQGFEQRFVERY